ncbi:hypothetical protein [Kamptonema formosum]|uniref:hypothetical protein n=1 Tax=Kamptonema formosum TaxID=331992 RepID=UPI00034D0193|nr:hypothetical protein [Oscillatoria sp. PCC 10802]
MLDGCRCRDAPVFGQVSGWEGWGVPDCRARSSGWGLRLGILRRTAAGGESRHLAKEGFALVF